MFHHPSNRKRRDPGLQKRGMSLMQAAKYLQVEQSTLYRALQKGQIPTRRNNGRTVVSQGALLDYRARKQDIL